MPLGLFLYKFFSCVISPFVGIIFRRRARAGKEDASRLSERFARNLPARANGPLVWLHGASVGETQLLMELARQILAVQSNPPNLLFTCQTQTAAGLIETALLEAPYFAKVSAVQQMAPIDTPFASRRFLDHWQPDLALIAEGEIWPNLLLGLQRRSVRTALVNARMTEKTIRGWMRWRTTSQHIFSSFDLMIAADVQTKTGLEALSGKSVISPGNLKSALPAPHADSDELNALRKVIGTRGVLLAASTHSGEEALVLDAYMQMSPRPFLIIAPRHPDRGDDVEGLLTCTSYAIARRSKDEPVRADTDILLADTMGEMGLWYRLADLVYLGGGHAPGVGGHNPLEALQLAKPVVTGPSLFNFKDLAARLIGYQGFAIVEDALALANAFPGTQVAPDLIALLEADAIGPMVATLDALQPLLPTTEPR